MFLFIKEYFYFYFRLEKEFETDDSKDDSLRRKEIPRGPIVVITNSSSCEDVHSAEEDESSKKLENSNDKTNEESQLESSTIDTTCGNSSSTVSNTISSSNESSECDNSKKLVLSDKSSVELSKSEANKIPLVPARSKLVNGSKISDKSRIKSDKSEKDSPSHSTKTKKSYPTPSVPPRMSKHLPARRTRSDPCTPDQPSRIPRPISSSNRSPTSTPNSKSPVKISKSSPKTNSNKKLKFSESPKSNRNTSKTMSEAPVTEAKMERTHAKTVKAAEVLGFEDNFVIDVKADAENASNTEDRAEKETAYETDNLVEIFETKAVDSALAVNDSAPQDVICESVFPSGEIAKEERHTNPFKKTPTNPFNGDVESKNPFTASSNPFGESPEVTPVLQPKGQMTASLVAPPIPER